MANHPDPGELRRAAKTIQDKVHRQEMASHFAADVKAKMTQRAVERGLSSEWDAKAPGQLREAASRGT
jgi:hypothetical protein